MTRPAISVALCTYNGERFLPQQLASILRQTQLPDEMIIRDDGSTDSTLALVEAFQKQAPFPVNFQRNGHNLGSTTNFEQAIFACRGELIALCDQDDVWHPHRLARGEQELVDHPEAGLVFSDAEVIDDLGGPLNLSLWENFAFDRKSLEALQAGDVMPLTRRTFVTGATVMFRACYAAACFPTGKHWLHDGWLTMLIACLATVRPIDEKLIAYRFHGGQQVGLGPEIPDDEKTRDSLEDQAGKQAATVAYFFTVIDEICRAVDRLSLTRTQREYGAAAVFKRHRDFLAMRLALPPKRLTRLPIILENTEQYRVSAMGALSMMKDLILPKAPVE